MAVLHPKIQALRNSVGHNPIHFYYPSKKQWSDKPLELRAPKQVSPDNDRLIKQYFCLWGVPDDYGTVFQKGAFSKSIEERGPNSKSNYKIVTLWCHDQKDPLCVPKVLIEDENGLYAEYEPDPVPSGDRCVLQVRSGTINQGSHGFNYLWDKMEFDDSTGLIIIKEAELFEISPVSIGSQKEAYVVRSAKGEFIDEFLEEETEDLIKNLPRKFHLEIRSIINRHISLAKLQPLETRKTALKDKTSRSKDGIDYDYLIKNLKN